MPGRRFCIRAAATLCALGLLAVSWPAGPATLPDGRHLHWHLHWGAIARAAAPTSDQPSEAARRVAATIRREALLPPRGPHGRPLPLVSHWNVGTVDGTFTPEHQIELLQNGHHIMPWLAWPTGDPQSERFQQYYRRLLHYYSELKLPISIRGTQFDAMLVRKSYREGPESHWAGVITPDGRRVAKLSPFSPLAPWKDPAKEYIDTAAMKWVQQAYPDPPLVLLVSNNEPPDLRWAKHGPLEEVSGRYLKRYGPGQSDEFKRRVVGEGWIERYGVMFNAMRAALVSPAWRENARFVGYGALGPSHFGRWDGWKVYSLTCDRWTAPEWHVWDGGSPSYYTHNWNANRDYWVFSTQVESMNWVFMLDEAWEANPDFWFEMSTWDGNEVNVWAEALGVPRGESLVARSSTPAQGPRDFDPKLVKKAKVLQYLADGQTYSPERTAGWVQFGMWLLRPRVVREFRGHATPLEPVKAYWLETVKAVDRVHHNPILTEFWRHGRLVRNDAHLHPYQSDIPERLKGIRRWYLLDTSADPPRPWNDQTPLPVFSLALELGEAGARRWLVYAHAPLESQQNVSITLPDYGKIEIDVPRGGAFHVVDESSRTVQRVDPAQP